MGHSAGVYMLQPKHAAALEPYRSDPALGPLLAEGTAAFVKDEIAARHAGTGFPFTIEDHGTLVGLCRLSGVAKGVAKGIDVWIAPKSRGNGLAKFAARMLVEFAFRNLALAEVRTRAPDAASAHVLERIGFTHDAGTGEHLATRERWRDAANAPALAKLHPALRLILDAELKAGNEITETSLEGETVFVRLKRPFAPRKELPAGVRYAEINDPHWWTAQFTAGDARHILAY